MELVLTAQIPDDVVANLQNGEDTPLARRFLELAAIGAYKSDLLSAREIMEMLGFEVREELYAFFKRYDVRSDYTSGEMEKDVPALDELLEKHGR
ncbi:MAG: UPF0175 family protein [Blastocatellia bacterium]